MLRLTVEQLEAINTEIRSLAGYITTADLLSISARTGVGVRNVAAWFSNGVIRRRVLPLTWVDREYSEMDEGEQFRVQLALSLVQVNAWGYFAAPPTQFKATRFGTIGEAVQSGYELTWQVWGTW